MIKHQPTLSARVYGRVAGAKKVAVNFISDFDFGIVLSIGLANVVTALCAEWDVSTSSSALTVLLTLIAFPLTFSINEAYGRRQRTLESIATLQSELWTFNAYHRRWTPQLELDKEGLGVQNCGGVFKETTSLMEAVREFCVQERSLTRNVSLEKVYTRFRVLREANADLCSHLGRHSDSKLNDVNLYHPLSSALAAFERIRVARDYPTPRSARNTYKVLGVIYPALLAPLYIADNQEGDESWGPYYVATLVALVFGLLISVQDKLDNPFNTYEIPSNDREALRLVSKHPDNIDLSRFVFWPMLAISGEVVTDNDSRARPACTLRGGPTEEVQELLRRRSSLGRHFEANAVAANCLSATDLRNESRSGSPDRRPKLSMEAFSHPLLSETPRETPTSTDPLSWPPRNTVEARPTVHILKEVCMTPDSDAESNNDSPEERSDASDDGLSRTTSARPLQTASSDEAPAQKTSSKGVTWASSRFTVSPVPASTCATSKDTLLEPRSTQTTATPTHQSTCTISSPSAEIASVNV